MTRDNSLELAQAEGTQTMTFVVEDSNLGGIAFTKWVLCFPRSSLLDGWYSRPR
jgi:hypothetical protein